MSLAGQIGLLATRIATEIKADRASIALKAPLASPALTGTPTAPTPAKFDSSTKIATTAFIAANAANQYQAIASGGTRQYQRIATLNGGSSSGGANIELLIGGLGDYGSARRGNALVSVAQRGTNPAGITGKVVWLTLAPTATDFYTVSTGNYTLELWMLSATYQYAPQVTVLQTAAATVTMDSVTTTAPANLVAIGNTADLEVIGQDVYQANGRLGWIGDDLSGGDWNQNLSSGFFRGTNMTNNPVGDNGWSWVLNQAHDAANWRGQIALGYTGGGAGRLYSRYQNNGTWAGWREYAALTGGVAFTGTSPTAPTPGVGANDTRIATTAYVMAGFAQIGGDTFTGNVNIGATSGKYLGLQPLQAKFLNGANDNGGMVSDGAGSVTFSTGSSGTLNLTSGSGGVSVPYAWATSVTSANTTPASTDSALVTVNSAGLLRRFGSGTIFQPQVYTDVISTRAVMVSSNGHLGTTASSQRVKDLSKIVTWDDNQLRKWLGIPVWEFTYKPELLADPAEVGMIQHGVVAEQVERRGFERLLYRDEREDSPTKGQVQGFAYEKMGLYNHLAMRAQQRHIDELVARIAALESRIPA